MVIPLPPIAFYTKKYCRQNGLGYKTEHDSVVDYITNLDLEDYIGTHKSQEVVFLGDSGYDCAKIETATMKKKWKFIAKLRFNTPPLAAVPCFAFNTPLLAAGIFIIALCKTRSVKSEKQYRSTPKSKDWTQIAEFFKNHRCLKWLTVRIFTNGSKIKRKDFRIRQITGFLRNVRKVQLICSEFKKRPDGRRKYLACNDFKATARQVLLGYRMRWLIEIFHKEVKMHLGFEDVPTRSFKSVMAHVHWVYCTYILLSEKPPGVPDNVTGIIAKQHRIKEIVDSKKASDLLQFSTRFDGLSMVQHELREALQPMPGDRNLVK